jgi:hypothetical protein
MSEENSDGKTRVVAKNVTGSTSGVIVLIIMAINRWKT